MLFAYYIAAVNIEQAYHQRKAGGGVYEPFKKELRIEPLMYRPFFPQWCHWEKSLNTGHYSLDEIFPPVLSDEKGFSLSLSLSPLVDIYKDQTSSLSSRQSQTSRSSRPRHGRNHETHPKVRNPIIFFQWSGAAAGISSPDCHFHGAGKITTCLPRWKWRETAPRGRLRQR